MRDLLRFWLITKMIGEMLALIGIGLSVGFVAWAVFFYLPKVIGEVFMF